MTHASCLYALAPTVSRVLINIHIVCVTYEYVTCSTRNVSCQHVFTCLDVRVLMYQKLKNQTRTSKARNASSTLY
jgi:hypothetical protein